MHIEPLIYTLFGLVIGSFLNVCIYRIPLGKSIVSPRSACPNCGTLIHFFDNIPVLSYLVLRGKCRSCGHPISIQYPVVELLTGAAFYACASRWDFAPPTYVNTLLLSVVIVLVFTDYHHQILPNVLTLPGIAAGLCLSHFQSISFYSFDFLSLKTASWLWPGRPQLALPWVGSLVGSVIGGGLPLLVGLGYKKLRKRQGLGMGDVKMMAMVGAFLGYPLAILTLLLGSFFGSLVGILLMIFRHANLQTKLALGVFLGISTTISLFCGLSFLQWYWHMAR